MNPAFAIIVILCVVAFWFLASSLYRPLGKFFYKIGKDASDIMNEDDDNDNKNTERKN